MAMQIQSLLWPTWILQLPLQRLRVHHPFSISISVEITIVCAGSVQRLLDAKEHFDRIGRFRILVMGRANAGRMTILQRVCNTTDLPQVFDSKGNKVHSCMFFMLTSLIAFLAWCESCGGLYWGEPGVNFRSMRWSLSAGTPQHRKRAGLSDQSRLHISRLLWFWSRFYRWVWADEEICDRSRYSNEVGWTHPCHLVSCSFSWYLNIPSWWHRFCIPMTDFHRTITAAETKFFDGCDTGNGKPFSYERYSHVAYIKSA